MGWPEALDEMEARAAQAWGVAAGGPPPPPFHLPEDLGEIPAGLRARAEAVLEATRQAARCLEAVRARVTDRLEAGGAPAPAGPPPAVYVDASA